MKIRDVVIREGGSGGAAQAQKKAAQQQAATAPTLDDGGGYDAMGNPTSSMPSASPTNVAAPAPKGSAGQAKWPTTDAEIRAFQQANGLKVDGMIGGKTMAALQKAGAQPPAGFKPVGNKQPKPATKPPAGSKPAANPTNDPYDPNKDPNVRMTPNSEIQAAQSDADKRNAIGGNLPPVAAAPAPAPAPEAPTNTAANVPQGGAGPNTSPWGGKANAPSANAMADFQRLAGITPTVSPSGQAAQPSRSNVPPGLASATTPQGSSEQPSGQAAQPQANPDGTGIGANATVNPDTGASTVAPPVKTGTGGTLTTSDGKPVTSRSDDEIAWANANPQNRYNPNGYPGPGNWDPRTGRSKKDIEQGQKNWDAIKGFFSGNKGQGAQPSAGPTGNVNNQSSGYTQKESSELAMLRKLSGLK